jgi:hypothetical protein
MSISNRVFQKDWDTRMETSQVSIDDFLLFR